MKRFLFVTVEGGGNVPPVLGLARRLREQGHEVRVLGDPVAGHDARSLGLDFAAFARAPHQNCRSREHDRLRDWATQNPLKQAQRMLDEVTFGPALAYARDVLEQLDRFPADAVAVDYIVLGAALAAEKAGLPYAMLMHTPYALPAPGMPPFGLGLTPGQSFLARQRDRTFSWLSAKLLNGSGLGRINAARRALGLLPLSSVFEQFDRAARVLIMTAPGFDFVSRARLPANVEYVGPGLDDPAWVEPYRSPFPSAAPEPLVVVGLGSTFQNQGALTRKVIEALGGMPVRGLVTLGNVFAPHELPAPPNVALVRSAPHGAVFPEASAVICHGGHGTVIKGLSHGLPVLCISLARDQHDNAARVEACGAGLRLPPSASVANIRGAVERLLCEPSFREHARLLAAEIDATRRADPALRAMKSLSQARGAARSPQPITAE